MLKWLMPEYKDVVGCKLQDYRLKLAKAFGIETIDAARTDVLKEVERLTSGRKADIVFEAAGSQESMLLAQITNGAIL